MSEMRPSSVLFVGFTGDIKPFGIPSMNWTAVYSVEDILLNRAVSFLAGFLLHYSRCA